MECIEGMIFPGLRVKHVACHKLCCVNINMFVYFWPHHNFSWLCWIKKSTQKNMRLMVHTRARSFHIGRCCAILNNVGPKQFLVWFSIISVQNNLRYKCIIGGQVATLMEDTIFHWWTIGDIGELYWLAKFNLSRGTCLIFYVLFPIWFKSYINFDKLSLTCGGSQIVFHESQHVCVFVDHIIIFLVFVELKKMPKVIWRLMFHLRAREFPHLTMWCNFE